MFLVEKDEAALEWTERNVEEYRAAAAAGGSSLQVVAADATEVASPGQPLGHLAGAVDVVCANPPYIPDAMVPREIEVRDHDPAVALYGAPMDWTWCVASREQRRCFFDRVACWRSSTPIRKGQTAPPEEFCRSFARP